MLVFGTRPEAIKMAPLVKSLQVDTVHFQTVVCVTGQHREMLDQVLHIFNIRPDYDLNVMQQGQDLYDVTSRIMLKMREVLQTEHPDLMLVHDDLYNGRIGCLLPTNTRGTHRGRTAHTQHLLTLARRDESTTHCAIGYLSLCTNAFMSHQSATRGHFLRAHLRHGQYGDRCLALHHRATTHHAFVNERTTHGAHYRSPT